MHRQKLSTRSSRRPLIERVLSPREPPRLGDGRLAYIKEMSSAEAQRLYPAVEGLPRGIHVYALHAADGTPIALTDSRQAAIGHALGDKLEVASVH
jgi:hypothetical protein